MPYRGIATVPRLSLFFVMLSSFAWVLPVPAADLPAEDRATFDKSGKLITVLCASDDVLWIGTEDMDLWRLDLKADPTVKETWKQFTSKDTTTDYVYGIVVDAAGRVWVGIANQGVNIYNGSQWRNYSVLDGCFGERVFAIAADRSRSHVWIGTDQGHVCWSPTPDGKGK